MNIRILTFVRNEKNIGQRLQAFALQRFIFDKFHEKALVYDYRSPLFNPHNINNKLREFQFDKNIMWKEIYSVDDIKNDNCDYIIFGSDQIMVNKYFYDFFPVELLDILNKNYKKIIPYAACFSEYKTKHNPLSHIKMKCFGFRCRTNLDVLNKFDIHAESEELNVNLDPVLLLDPSDYVKYESYTANDIFRQYKNIDSTNTEYVVQKNMIDMEVEELIYNINHCNNFIITDSFHCFCLSILFKKKCKLINSSRYCNRIKEIINLLSIKLDSNGFVTNFEEIHENIKKQKELSFLYLQKYLSDVL